MLQICYIDVVQCPKANLSEASGNEYAFCPLRTSFVQAQRV
mgnify:CR=1 FL=1